MRATDAEAIVGLGSTPGVRVYVARSEALSLVDAAAHPASSPVVWRRPPPSLFRRRRRPPPELDPSPGAHVDIPPGGWKSRDSLVRRKGGYYPSFCDLGGLPLRTLIRESRMPDATSIRSCIGIDCRMPSLLPTSSTIVLVKMHECTCDSQLLWTYHPQRPKVLLAIDLPSRAGSRNYTSYREPPRAARIDLSGLAARATPLLLPLTRRRGHIPASGRLFGRGGKEASWAYNLRQPHPRLWDPLSRAGTSRALFYLQCPSTSTVDCRRLHTFDAESYQLAMRIGANHYIRPEATLRRFGRYGVQGDTAIAQPPSCVERRECVPFIGCIFF
ncbi:hypothetical protein C8R45DRAFT_920909 [Mycena sanguinolenta]|nr:hypothetical protein C8R45DRAFT_920909 [Mycena sanguinolenta]